MVNEVLTDDKGRATGVAYFDERRAVRRRRPPISSSCPASATEIGPAAAELEVEAVSRPASATATTGSVATCRDMPTAARGACSRTRSTTTSGPARRSRSAISTTASRAARRRHAGQRVHPPAVPVHAATGPPARRAGAARTRISSGRTSSAASACRARAGDAGVRLPRRGRSRREGPLGHPGGAHLGRDGTRTISRSRRFMASKAEAWLKETGATRTWPATARHGRERRTAPGGHVPHGQRPEDLRREPSVPGPRRRQPLRRRRQRARHQRRLQPGADDHGARVLGVGLHHAGVEGDAGSGLERHGARIE